MSALVLATHFVAMECCVCGVAFALGADYHTARKNDHKFFSCPNEHQQHYAHKSELEKARDALSQEKHRLEQKDAEARRLRERLEWERANHAGTVRRLNATRGVVTRHKKKIAAGRCPCCSHQFKDLAKHMQARHPKWNPELQADVMADKGGAP